MRNVSHGRMQEKLKLWNKLSETYEAELDRLDGESECDVKFLMRVGRVRRAVECDLLGCAVEPKSMKAHEVKQEDEELLAILMGK